MPSLDSPFDRPVATKIDKRVRFLAIYIVPTILLVTALVYMWGEWLNWNGQQNLSSPGSANGILFFGAFLWAVGQLLNLITLVANSAGLGFTQNRRGRKVQRQR